MIFFVNLLDMGTKWVDVSGDETQFEGRDRTTGIVRWTATRVDLVFGSNSQLRAIAEAFATSDAEPLFVKTIHCRLDKSDGRRSFWCSIKFGSTKYYLKSPL